MGGVNLLKVSEWTKVRLSFPERDEVTLHKLESEIKIELRKIELRFVQVTFETEFSLVMFILECEVPCTVPDR